MKEKNSLLPKPELIDSVIIVEQIDKFKDIITKVFPKRIAQTDELLRKDFNLEHLKKFMITEKEIEKAFPVLNNKKDIDEYRRLYALTLNYEEQFLFPNGLFAANRHLERLIDLVMGQFKELYECLHECCFTIELLLPRYEKRNVFEYSFLNDTLQSFKEHETTAFHRYKELYKRYYDYRASVVYRIAKNPQFEDYRKLLLWKEYETIIDLIDLETNLFYFYLCLMDMVVKNGDKFALHLNKAYRYHSKLIKQNWFVFDFDQKK